MKLLMLLLKYFRDWDRVKECLGKWKEILHSSSVETNNLAPYYHWINVLAEVNVKIFTNQIRKLFQAEQDRENWHQFTPFIQMYMNNRIIENTLSSSF